MNHLVQVIQIQLKFGQVLHRSRIRSAKFESLYVYSAVYGRSLLKLIMASNRYCIDLAKRGTAGCKNCNSKIDKGVVRVGKIIPNPFTDSGGEMKQWFHVRCIFDKLSRARATTKKIESTEDLEGWDELADEHKPEVLKHLKDFASNAPAKKTPVKKKPKKASKDSEDEEDSVPDDEPTADDAFFRFVDLCEVVAKDKKYSYKHEILSEFFTKGSDKKGFKGNLYLWMKMLLPAVEKRVYNLKSTQIVKIFSTMFDVSSEEMFEELEQCGDVSKVVMEFFEQSRTFSPAKESTLYLQDVDKYLEELSKTGHEVEHRHILKKLAKRCTGMDLMYVVRLIKYDLRINAGPKHVLEAVHESAFEAFQASRNLEDIVKRTSKLLKKGSAGGSLAVKTSLMTPVLPMLAMACKDLITPFNKYLDGFYVEMKYDGERVQIHKKGKEFSYFSRSLKPVVPHKVNHFKDYIPKAFPHGNDLMLDCEILLVTDDGKPLPFGTLGAHRKTAFKDASVCLFVFDCLQYNDENLMKRSLFERRQLLKENMNPIKNHIMFSEMKEIEGKKEPKAAIDGKKMAKLQAIVDSVIEQGLEGLVIKDKYGIYEPGKRHWLKVKKDYLTKGGNSMADSVDLVVLGGYYGTGRKGGIMSVFLMGCCNRRTKKWCTVTKVPGGSDDTLTKLNDTLEMIKISRDALQVPDWLNVNKALIPDFVSANIKKSPVWEISGAEFSKAEVHTANGISIRFPRVKRFRDDKDYKTANDLEYLQKLFDASKSKKEIVGLQGDSDMEDDADEDISFFGENNANTSSSSSTGESSKMKNNTPDKITSKKHKRISNEPVTPIKKVKLDLKIEKSTESKKNDLPDFFSGVKLYIPSSVENFEKLRRYFLAYDGDLLKEHRFGEASHVILPTDKSTDEFPKEARKVTADWLWDCIKLQKKLPTKPYKPDSSCT